MINDALQVADDLEAQGISAALVKINCLGRNGLPETLASLRRTGVLLCMEEVCAAGCVGELLLTLAAESGISLRGARLMNLGEGIVAHGGREQLLRDHGLDREHVCQAARELL